MSEHRGVVAVVCARVPPGKSIPSLALQSVVRFLRKYALRSEGLYGQYRMCYICVMESRIGSIWEGPRGGACVSIVGLWSLCAAV